MNIIQGGKDTMGECRDKYVGNRSNILEVDEGKLV